MMRKSRGLIVLGVLASAFLSASPASAAVVDPERNSTALTGWWWNYGATETNLNDVASANGARITDIEVESTSPYRFSAAFVKNTGTYARTWWWYYGLTSTQVAQKVSSLNARIIDIERYQVGGQRRFAIVLVKNSGNAAKSWWYWYDVTSAFIAGKLNQKNARLIDLESYSVGGKTRYAAVMIKNTGVDAKSWWWYLNVTPSFISGKLAAKKARLVDIDRRSNGRFDVVMQKRDGGYWWWYYDQSAANVAKRASQNGARIVDIERYTKGGATRFAILLRNDLNAESTRLREIMRTGLGGSSYGFYVKKVGGSAPVALQSSTIFEPASSIKVVHHLYTLRRIQLGTGGDTLATSVDYYVKPGDTTNKDVCPDPAWESNPSLKVTTTLQDALNRMMMNSDNRTTRTFQVRYGYPTINAYLDSIGATDTEFRQILGCGFNNNLRNDFTLVDAGKIYEGVVNGSLLSGTARDSFWTLMLGGGVSATSPLGLLVKQEAASLGKSNTVANNFIANMDVRSKGGSYDICGTGCNSYTYIRTSAGRITIPFKVRAGAVIIPTNYVYGRFADGLNIPCSPKSGSETAAQAEARCSKYKKANAALNSAGTEMFRTIIRSALKTW